MAFLRASLLVLHSHISSIVRQQPWHSKRLASIWHTDKQGDGMFSAMALTDTAQAATFFIAFMMSLWVA
jgi:hypothetical protein